MYPFKKSLSLKLLLTAILFAACSPQKKVQQYSYLLKHKAEKKSAQVAAPQAIASTSMHPSTQLPQNTLSSPGLIIYAKKPRTLKAKKTAQESALSQVSKREHLPSIYQASPKGAKTEIRSSIKVSEAPSASTTTVHTSMGYSVMAASENHIESQKLIKAADKYLGSPYKYAGMSKQGIDCSGLICQAYAALDLKLPRNSRAMADKGRKIDVEEVKVGDLLFFHSYKGKGINHVAMVRELNGNDVEFIHATVSNGVRKDRLSDPFWKQRFRKAVRPALKR